MDRREQDRRVEEAKASLVARVEELGRRFSSVRDSLDVKTQIVAHPWMATGAAFALGVVLGVVTGGKRGAPDQKRGIIGGALVAIAISALKEAALYQLRGLANSWLENREGPASHERETESFLEH